MNGNRIDRLLVLPDGAKVLQRNAPLAKSDIYLNGFHPMKDRPEQQVEAHHFCRQVDEDLAQCALFDGNTATANLNGIEYIISGKLFNTLPRRSPASPNLQEERDTRMQIDTAGKRRGRANGTVSPLRTRFLDSPGASARIQLKGAHHEY